MNKWIFTLSFAVAGLLFAPVPALAQYSGEYISAFDVAIDVRTDSTLQVTEYIDYVFVDSSHHGIERYIPYSYKRNGATYTTPITINSIVDEDNIPYEFTSSTSGGFQYLRIGSPDAYVTEGAHTYIITYTVERAINYFDDHDEVYWNVTGNDWDVPIDSAFALVTFPEGVAQSDVSTACYTGYYDSTASDCTSNWTEEGLGFLSLNSFSTGEGMSIVAGLPKGVVAEPTAFEKFLFFLQAYWYFLIPIAVFIFLHLRWMKKGRDPKGRGTIVPQYEAPDNLTPGLMGALWDEKADTRDISATIIYLATQGYIKIKETGKKKYEFTRLKKGDELSKLHEIEQKVMDALYSGDKDTVSLASLKNKFYKDLPGIQEAMYSSLVTRGYYVANPAKTKKMYYGIGTGIAVLLFFGGGVGGGIAVVAGILSAVLFIIYGRIMPQKTPRGAEVKEEIEGFKWFLSVTEKERLKFHNAPEKKPEAFIDFLPFAMALGVEKQWAEQFKDIYIEAPSWYEGTSGAAFNAIYFGSILSTMNSSMTSTFTSRPSSAGSGGSGFGGGGFSGGGFGGGGGGSW